MLNDKVKSKFLFLEKLALYRYICKEFYMFSADRTFSIKNQETGLTEWYFQAREGNAGPFESKKDAETGLKEFIKYCVDTSNTGGRDTKPKQPGAMTPTSTLNTQSVFSFGSKAKINWF